MTKTLRILFAFLLIPVGASAQWQFQSVFPDTSGGKASPITNTAHGIAVDGEGKVWVGPYNSSLVPFTYPSGIVSTTARRNMVRVYNSDGTEAAFSPLYWSNVGDSLLKFAPITGLTSDASGNVYIASHGYRLASAPTDSTRDDGGIWRSDRAFIHKYAPNGTLIKVFDVTEVRVAATATALQVAHAPNSPGVTTDGNIAVSYVFGGSPIKIFDGTTGDVITTVTASKRGFSRSFAISPDGNRLFSPNSGDGGMIDEWVSPDGVFGEYKRDSTRTLGLGMQSGAVVYYPGGILYATAAGIGNNPDAQAPWNSTRTYGLSVNSGQKVDSLRWEYGTATAFAIPRSIAISADGLTMYLGTFSTGIPAVQKFTRTSQTSVERDNQRTDGFALSQNYPNPFNPSTSISYTLPEAGMTTLKVYDMLGREVATLVNGVVSQGSHTVTFNAENLGSGVYMYELRSGNTRITNKMTLMK
jgi:sugar lactone lactonase YvrE